MRNLALLLLITLLPACGMKGPLYEPAPPAAPAAATEPPAEETDKVERKTIPPTPDPAKSL